MSVQCATIMSIHQSFNAGLAIWLVYIPYFINFHLRTLYLICLTFHRCVLIAVQNSNPAQHAKGNWVSELACYAFIQHLDILVHLTYLWFSYCCFLLQGSAEILFWKKCWIPSFSPASTQLMDAKPPCCKFLYYTTLKFIYLLIIFF